MGGNHSICSKLLGGRKSLETIISQPNFSIINNMIPPSKWLSKMDHGKAISNTFQRPVFLLPESLGLGAFEGNQRIKNNATHHWFKKICFSSHMQLNLEVGAQGLLLTLKPGPPVYQENLICFGTVTVQQILVKSLLEKGWSNNRSFTSISGA
ncbi:hypothetical protein VP01_1479g1 [Puccinia sorghi]|uniref:Uncharacterized protein n=1 Tax=Puccinia sorghi TaxID=27349 RepID=A0A0L6VK68_9BASI|nr:hypothetical protein VP01_1479g1 [Puccinia sorghi]